MRIKLLRGCNIAAALFKTGFRLGHHVLEIDSNLCNIVGKTEMYVNSYHHQAVREIADGLRVTATAPDGIIEAVESEDGRILGVQWHPESLCAVCEEHAKIFTNFIERCRADS